MNMKVVNEHSAVLSFRREQRNRLYCLSRTFLLYGLLVLGVVLGLELFLWEFPGLAILKLPAAALLLCSLAVAYLLPRRFREGLRVWQGANLAVLSCTAAVQLFLLLESAARTTAWHSVVLGESIAALGLVYLFGYPFRRFAVVMAGIPYAAAAVAALVVYGRGGAGLSLLVVPVPLLLALALVARVEERLAFKAFRMRRIAERGKAKLEEELTREGLLVKQLEEARSALKKEVEERKRIEEGLERIAAFDELTSVYNRRAGLEVLKEAFHYSRRKGLYLSVVFLDIDKLKLVNDNYGHSAGDEYLKEVVRTLRTHLRKSDSICRYGGDEFIIILNDCPREKAAEIFSRIEADLKSGEPRWGLSDLSFSYGTVEAPPEEGEVSIEQLIARADERMYIHKQRKKRRWGGAQAGVWLPVRLWQG